MTASKIKQCVSLLVHILESLDERRCGAVQVEIQLPRVEGSDRLDGRLLQVEVPSLRMIVGELKARLADTLDLPSNRQAVSREGAGFLKDEYSLAFYNVGPTVQLSLRARERGGARRG